MRGAAPAHRPRENCTMLFTLLLASAGDVSQMSGQSQGNSKRRTSPYTRVFPKKTTCTSASHFHHCSQWVQLNFFKIQSDLVWNSDSIAVKTPCLFFLCLQLRPLMIQRQAARICGLLSASVCKAVNWDSFHLLK